MSSSDCSTIIVVGDLNRCKEKFSSEKLRSLLNNMAQDPEINAFQELVEDFQYNPGNAFAFVNMNSEDAANRIIEKLNESKLDGCEHLQASFVPNTLIFGNSSEVNDVKGIVFADPWGRPSDGTWENRGTTFSWDKDNHHHETAVDDNSFECSQGGWEQGNEVIDEDNFIKTTDDGGWGAYINNSNIGQWDIEQQNIANEGIIAKKYENGQQNLYTSGIRGGTEVQNYRTEGRSVGNEGGRLFLEMSGINFSDMMAHIKFGVSH